MNKRKISVDFTGKVIDYLSVVKWHGIGGAKGDTEWLCRCECGELCIKRRSFLSNKIIGKKTCGNCVEGKPVIGNIFKSFKIRKLLTPSRKTGAGFFLGKCIHCGAHKRISKLMIKKIDEPTRKRNLTCPRCLINSRRGGDLKVGDQIGYLRIVAAAGLKGHGRFTKFYWRVECLFNGPGCKGIMEYSTADLRNKISCGCKWAQDRQLIQGMSRRNHPYYKLYQLRKNCYDKCHKVGHKNYHAYGGRGIYMYEEWRPKRSKADKYRLFAFVEWCLENGWQEGLHLDRIDNDGPYSPDNCQFIPAIENIFYASIDNANEAALRAYIRYFKLWETAFNVLREHGEEIEQDFARMLTRWKIRIDKRAEKIRMLVA